MSQQHPQYQPAPQHSPYAMQQQMPAPVPPPKKKRTGLKIVLGGLAAFCVLVVGSCAAFTAGGVASTANPGPVVVTEKPVQEPDAAEAPQTEEPTAEAPQTEEPAEPAEAERAEPEPAGPEVVKVSAAKIIKAFEDNELKADKKYKGKTLEVSGEVSKVDTELFDEDKYILSIDSGEQWSLLTVSAYDIPSDQLEDLDEGDKVTVVGEFSDGGDLGVTLRNAHVK